MDAEKSVQSRHGDSLWAEKKREGMLVNQSKAGIRTAYGQRNESVDGEKSVQSWHGDSLWAEKRERGWRKVSQKQACGQPMGRETRVWMPRNQSKADIGTAYG